MKNRIFEIMQRLGRSFMLPIAILPVAGILLGVGSSFTNTSMLQVYGLESVMGQGTLIYGFFTILYQAGNIIFDNLPLLFAVGTAIGMSKSGKEIGALAAVLSYLVMNSAIYACLLLDGTVLSDGTVSKVVLEGTITEVLGITTFQMGAFGGIIVGIGAAYLNNRFHTTELPAGLSFFEGNRFVLIINTCVYVIVGILLYFFWPYVQVFIYATGNLVASTGYIGTFVFGFLKRCLIPLGLHHVFYFPFWQTAIGGAMTISGRVVTGAQNIFFAQLADPSTTFFSVDACRFFSGEFIFMIFGLPGAALAIVQTAEPSQRKKIAGLMGSAAFACILTGITEPLEFSFLFVAPGLYVIHCILAGLAYMIAHILHIAVGLTFSGGLIDLFLFGVLQGNAKTNWLYILPVGAIYFLVYYSIFRFVILKYDLKTPGRDIEKDVMPEIKSEKLSGPEEADMINPEEQMDYLISGLGGLSNIDFIDSCATRLRCTVYEDKKISLYCIEKSGSFGILHQGNNVQIIYGPKVGTIKKQLEKHLKEYELQQINAPEKIYSYARGQVIPLESVEDIVFSSGILGEGFAILPVEQKIYAPVDGVISSVADTKHAIGITSRRGVEVLIHIGIDTVRLKGEGFSVAVKNGQKVRCGDLLATFDKEMILEKGYSITSPLIISNTDSYKTITQVDAHYAEIGEFVMEVS